MKRFRNLNYFINKGYNSSNFYQNKLIYTSLYLNQSFSSLSSSSHSSSSSSLIDLNLFRSSIRKWIELEISPNINKWEIEGILPRYIYKQASQLGIFSSGYPEEYGGLGNIKYDLKYTKIILEELCQVGSGGLIASLCTHSISLPLIIQYGNKSIVKKIATEVLNGDSVCSLCVTEPSGGSDVANIQTTAIKNSDGSYTLNGIKTFITSGIQADYYTVIARTLKDKKTSTYGISIFAISSNLPGITKTKLNKMGWLCSDTATIYFNDCIIPEDSLVGKLHEGFNLLMNNFNGERIFLSLQSYYFSVLIYNEVLKYSKLRKTFDKPLISNQVIQHQLVDIYSKIYSCEAVINDVCSLYERSPQLSPIEQKDLIVKISLLKNISTDLFHETANRGVQILGGAGFMQDNKIERLYRETKVMQIGGGSTEIMKELVIKLLKYNVVDE